MKDNIYRFSDDQQETDQEFNNQSDRDSLNSPVDKFKDLGGIPLPKDGDMGKWVAVIAVILIIAGLYYVGSLISSEMAFKNEQIKNCNNNFQTLNLKYVLKDQELNQLKENKGTNQQNKEVEDEPVQEN